MPRLIKERDWAFLVTAPRLWNQKARLPPVTLTARFSQTHFTWGWDNSLTHLKIVQKHPCVTGVLQQSHYCHPYLNINAHWLQWCIPPINTGNNFCCQMTAKTDFYQNCQTKPEHYKNKNKNSETLCTLHTWFSQGNPAFFAAHKSLIH